MLRERHDTETLRRIREQELRLLAAVLRERDQPLTDSERRQLPCPHSTSTPPSQEAA
jgi:hypothetical protein